MGVYREAEFSPGKVEADAAILDAVLEQLAASRAETDDVDSARFADGEFAGAASGARDVPGRTGLARLAAVEEAGAVVINSALAIRNCYRDLLGAGLCARACRCRRESSCVPAPLDLSRCARSTSSSPCTSSAAICMRSVPTTSSASMASISSMRHCEFRAPRRRARLRAAGGRGRGSQILRGQRRRIFRRGRRMALSWPMRRSRPAIMRPASGRGARARGLGRRRDVNGDDFTIVDFNDWPSFSRVRDDAARAIARRSYAPGRHLRTAISSSESCGSPTRLERVGATASVAGHDSESNLHAKRSCLADIFLSRISTVNSSR